MPFFQECLFSEIPVFLKPVFSGIGVFPGDGVFRSVSLFRETVFRKCPVFEEFPCRNLGRGRRVRADSGGFEREILRGSVSLSSAGSAAANYATFLPST